MNYLQNILDHKRAEVEERKKSVPVTALKDRPLFSAPVRSFEAALRSRPVAIIAEIKKASPSHGVFREQFDPLAIARAYETGGAAAVSVLTDEPFFQGRLAYLEEVRRAVGIPVLRKDFVIDEYQVIEARAYGADAILLIAAALDSATRVRLASLAEEVGLECLVEVHNAGELESLRGERHRLIGINNRDLTTFRTDLNTSLRLAPQAPPGALLVAESGIRSADDIMTLVRHGFRAVLVGGAFMRSPDPGNAVREMLTAVRAGVQ
jgi:indole-3-glycerol phosphate synthase